MKYLVLLGLIFGGLFLYRKFTAQAQRARMSDQAAPRRSPSQAQTKAITMVQCEHCHTHLPEHEALIRHGHSWCNAEHERLGPKA